MRSILFFFFLSQSLFALPYSLIKHESDIENNTTLLVIGGIHGNEPGSYFATAILTQYYTITNGNLWIIPNLNHKSILCNNRGVNGDMNRKFACIKETDPDRETVESLKTIITNPQVDLILNLHDGHGFYRKEYKNTIFNPAAWGQTCVIDQGTLDGNHRYKDLNKIANAVSQELNGGLIENHHCFDVRNTNTRFDDEAMQHSLTYFAINQNKPAFAIETSKNLPTLHEKVFYQLRAIEAYMRYMGIEYKRSFELSPENLEKLLNLNGEVTINSVFQLNLENIRSDLSFIPLKSDGNGFVSSHSLGGYVYEKGKYNLYIGNRKVVTLNPSVHPYGESEEMPTLIADKNTHVIEFAKEYFITDDFSLITRPNTRVNVIGFTKEGKKDESNITISLKDLDQKFSIDKDGKIYRAEFYRNDTFCGMILIHFK